ncbi:riboflavin biosynthesis protein RibD domain-containing protein [Sphaeroforma arctica JP610]|uniref:Riboflavin biosynthesis protein RibD domain-containing protein n=1 Tax=Sphaeroforma arctica JP610 TaxID=667725 RepID=A0A0L0GDD4_9EUKA|nr:riboflavin biosynthesis protein RibD domain-containing protein [Sphaeroforma arctica JP610]KNC86919.1 riboflavin biosynthesis protein RibD domain-containing protein [Sphaeroforma arctica JP610]|eukprot:XP_014160821.1 riboflavin biosynthesis protein RibD domain-containing protein [Sphaeroforma arctica JP610]
MFAPKLNKDTRPLGSIYVGMSLDGYIARKDGGIDFLDKFTQKTPKGEDCGYAAFSATYDVIVMGRNAFEKVLSFGFWPYDGKKCIVLSRNPMTFTQHPQVPADTEHSSEEPEVLMARLGNHGYKRVYIDGGVTAQRFLRAGQVDDLCVSTLPVIIGEGLPLFGFVPKNVWLELRSSTCYPHGLVQTTYKVIKE